MKYYLFKGTDKNTVFIIPTIELSRDYYFLTISFMIFYLGIRWEK